MQLPKYYIGQKVIHGLEDVADYQRVGIIALAEQQEDQGWSYYVAGLKGNNGQYVPEEQITHVLTAVASKDDTPMAWTETATTANVNVEL